MERVKSRLQVRDADPRGGHDQDATHRECGLHDRESGEEEGMMDRLRVPRHAASEERETALLHILQGVSLRLLNLFTNRLYESGKRGV